MCLCVCFCLTCYLTPSLCIGIEKCVFVRTKSEVWINDLWRENVCVQQNTHTETIDKNGKYKYQNRLVRLPCILTFFHTFRMIKRAQFLNKKNIRLNKQKSISLPKSCKINGTRHFLCAFNRIITSAFLSTHPLPKYMARKKHEHFF